MSTLAFLSLNNLGPIEMLALLALGLLLFGKRLPEVGRSLGRGIVEFKRGLKGMADEIEEESTKPAAAPKTTLPPPPPSAAAPQTKAAEEVRVSRSDDVE